jgi:hypothetical protein
MSRPGIKPMDSTVGGKHSRKEPFEQLVNSYSEHLHITVRQVENACDMAPPVHVLDEHT